MTIFIQNFTKFAHKFKFFNKISRNYKVYYYHLGIDTIFTFTTYNFWHLPTISLGEGLISQKLNRFDGKAKFDFVDFKVEYNAVIDK